MCKFFDCSAGPANSPLKVRKLHPYVVRNGVIVASEIKKYRI
jgi:hypothetical protein